MNIDTKTALRLSRMINAKRDRVFEAWTNPELLTQWSAPEGMEIPSCDVDLSVGGAYRFVMRSPDGSEYTAVGKYKEIDAPSRLVYTWDWEEESSHMGDTIVTVDFNDMGDATEVVITHELFPNEEARDSHESGWESCLNRLEGMNA